MAQWGSFWLKSLRLCVCGMCVCVGMWTYANTVYILIDILEMGGPEQPGGEYSTAGRVLLLLVILESCEVKSQLPGLPDLLISNDHPADKACHKQWEALEIFFLVFFLCVCFVCVCFKCWNWYYEIIVLGCVLDVVFWWVGGDSSRPVEKTLLKV